MKVMLVDDHPVVRAGLKSILEKNEKIPIQVTISSSCGRKAIREALADQPDMAIIDISMPGLDGLECTSRLHSHFPDMPILVLSMHEEPQYAQHAFESGARGYLTKRSMSTELIIAIKALYSGRRYMSESIKEAIAMTVAEGRSIKNSLAALSKREFQVMTGLVNGSKNSEIAEN